METLGTHLLAEFVNCNYEQINDVNIVKDCLENAALQANATIVQSVFHKFSPYGVSGVVVISESHLTIHTWPEYNYAAVDVFTCGDSVDPYVAIEVLKSLFSAEISEIKEVRRGHLSEVMPLRVDGQEIEYQCQ